MGKLEISLGWMMHDGVILGLRIAHTCSNPSADRNVGAEVVSRVRSDGGGMTASPEISVATVSSKASVQG
jgi:hypothetical protein